MSFLITVKEVKSHLITSARYAVLVSMLKAWDNCRIRRVDPEEPDIVASLVLNGTEIMENEWRKIFNQVGIQIAIAGIFCHQTPKVSYTGMRGKSCELGDLLWCHVHNDSNGKTTRNAILYQAKKSSDQLYQISRDDSDQLELYTDWPPFTYVNSGILTGQSRHITPSAPRRGAQYLLIDDRPPEHPKSGIMGIPGTYPMGSCIPNNPIIDHSDLGLELVHSLEFLSGDPFDDRHSASKENGWSKVVWDILESSAQKAFRRIRSGYSNEPRTSGSSPSEIDGCFYMTSPDKFSSRSFLLNDLGDFSFSNIDIPPKRRQEGSWFDEGGGGISVLLLETSEAAG